MPWRVLIITMYFTSISPQKGKEDKIVEPIHEKYRFLPVDYFYRHHVY